MVIGEEQSKFAFGISTSTHSGTNTRTLPFTHPVCIGRRSAPEEYSVLARQWPAGCETSEEGRVYPPLASPPVQPPHIHCCKKTWC